MQSDIKLSVTFAWWLKPYLFVLAFFCVLTRNAPDPAKLEANIKRGMRVTVR
ncbi:hypothetical protein ACLKMY_00515 [Paraburkholderia mimosarum]|uniref:hypothetical protein n=1 Tax=Paraburkholderia mimosarum TaxID=312026 RepID=UPI0039C02D23